jgi:hypothetical protein
MEKFLLLQKKAPVDKRRAVTIDHFKTLEFIPRTEE